MRLVRPQGLSGWYRAAVAALFILIGLLLAVGGAWLLALGGSFYYLLAGLGLIASGALIAQGRTAGVWLYVVVFALTLVWAFWEAGLDVWALVPRVFAPGVLLVLALMTLPALTGKRRSLWLAPAGAAVVAGVFVLAALVGVEHRVEPRPFPAPRALASAPPTVQGIATGVDWPWYGGTWATRRYSPLAQIDRSNVHRIERVWTYHTRDLPDPEAENNYSPETTPIKIGDTVYLCSAKNILIALDAGTGRERWRYDPGVLDDAIPYGASCRGVSWYRAPGLDRLAPCAERIIEATLDARLIAVDAKTGQPCGDFGVNGEVSLLTGIGDSVPGFYSVTSPPVIVRGVLVTGAQVLDGQRRNAPSGVVRGYDAVTGELRWAWDMEQPGPTGVPPEGQTYSRGTPNMWTIASGDEDLGHVYLPMGNAAVDYYGATRSPIENFYATSLLAIDVTTGRPAWRFQTVHYDLWDYDLGSQGTLVDFPTPAGPVPALVLPSKQGDIYILDRRTGRPLTPVVERRVPIGGVEPQNLSRTQPFSLYHTLRKPNLAERDMWGMSPIDQLFCRIQYRRAHYQGFYTPPTADRRWIQYPGYNGGSDWGGVAIDPVRGVIVANYNDMPNYNRLVPRPEANEKGWAPIDVPSGKKGPEGDPQTGVPYAIDVNAGWRVPITGLLCKEPPYGGIRAIELATGRTLWDQPLGTARRNGPFGIPTMLPFTIGTPNNGGAVVTAGGLIFIAATTDNLIRAIDIETGEVLWEDVLPAGGQATPITYAADGWQYVVIMAGGHHFMETPVGDAVVAYRLPMGLPGGGGPDEEKGSGSAGDAAAH